MTNLPENENLNDIPSAEISAEEEFSTIFSNPTEHKKKATDGKKRRRLPVVIASVLAVAILVSGTVAVIKLIPEKQEETPQAGIEDITVIDLKSDDIASLSVTNSNGTLKFLSKVETEKDSSGETKENVVWYIDGYAKDIVDDYSISSTVSSAVSISASREITQKTAAECGLESPIIKADIAVRKGEKFSLLIGADSPDNSGCYAKLSNSDKIYLVDSSVKTDLEFDALSFADTSPLPAISLSEDSKYATDGALSSFDSMTISGKNFSKPVVIESNDHEVLSTYAPYKTTSPDERLANSDNISPILSLFSSGVAVTGAYSYDVSSESLKKFGLDTPDFTVSVKAGKDSMTYKFALQNDGNYAAICDSSKLIKTVAASSLTFINYKTADLYWPFVSLTSIDDLKGFVYTVGDKSYEFTIAANEDEDSEDNYVITHEGEPIICSIFQDFYQICISLEACDYNIDVTKGDVSHSIEFIFKDDIGGSNLVEFIKVAETRYLYTIDGKPNGRVASADLNKLTKALEKVLAGEEI